MPRNEDMIIDDVIREIGRSITEIDVLRSKFDRGDERRKKLDGIRDDLDVTQRKLVRVGLTQSTEEFQNLAASLRRTNAEVLEEIQDLERIASTLEGLTALLGIAQKLLAVFV